MTAIVTDFLRKKLINYLFEEVIDNTDSNEYYIGFGKSDVYDSASDDVIDPVRTQREVRLARLNLQSMKKVNATSFVIPRYNWTSGTIYSGYSDSTVGIPTNAYYVLTEENDVYMCLQQGKNSVGNAVTSTVKPSYSTAGVSKFQSFATSDGYIWKYMYTISATNSLNFLSSNFMPIQVSPATDSSGDLSLTDAERFQAEVRENAVSGQITGAIIQNGGSGYTSAPTVQFKGNGSAAAATATISGGAVVKIEMNNESAAFGSGYDYASITFSGGGGSGAIARPIIGPRAGFGADPRDDLKANSIMMSARISGTTDTDFITDQDFRQIVLLNNVQKGDSADSSDDVYNSLTANTLKYLTLSSTAEAATFEKDNTIVGGTSGAQGFIDNIDSTNVFYHQNEATGFAIFQNSEAVTEVGGDGSGTIVDASPNLVTDNFTGNVLYIENRAAISRSTSQTEDIKVIITV